jgi:anti-sigma regulatory factor (Ser/Thr protein kinase)
VGTVELQFTALPAHVRTARLVAAAVARRSGVDEAALDEVRLAVGEACTRAVELHRRHCPAEPVRVTLYDDKDEFEVVVADCAPSEIVVAEMPEVDDLAKVEAGPGGQGSQGGQDGQAPAQPPPEESIQGYADVLPAGVGLAVIRGLADRFEVTSSDSGTTLRMGWSGSGLIG